VVNQYNQPKITTGPIGVRKIKLKDLVFHHNNLLKFVLRGRWYANITLHTIAIHPRNLLSRMS